MSRRRLFAVSLAMRTPGPTTWATLALLQFFLGASNTTLSRHLLFGVLHPTDELVARQWRDVHPRVHRRSIGDERLTQVRRQLVHHSSGNARRTHDAFFFTRGADATRGAIMSPNLSMRFNTSFASKRSRAGLPDLAHLSTSSHVTGVDAVGSGRARSEYTQTVVFDELFWLQSMRTLPSRKVL